jgi:CheY-like chemotaxis protein
VGSTFWFTARLAKGDYMPITGLLPDPDAAESIIGERFAGLRVLVVEDDEINREIAVEMLAETGLLIDTAEDGQVAVERVREADYALILMDMQMPRMDGLQATLQIRALPGQADTPIVAMTANAFAEDRARCFEVGMNDFIPKPVEPGLLLQVVLKWLERRAAGVALPGPTGCRACFQPTWMGMRRGWACSTLGMRRVSTPWANSAATRSASSSLDRVKTRRYRAARLPSGWTPALPGRAGRSRLQWSACRLPRAGAVCLSVRRAGRRRG